MPDKRARAQNAIWAKIDVQLLLERLLDIDFGEDPKALLLESFTYSANRSLEWQSQALGEMISHQPSFVAMARLLSVALISFALRSVA